MLTNMLLEIANVIKYPCIRLWAVDNICTFYKMKSNKYLISDATRQQLASYEVDWHQV